MGMMDGIQKKSLPRLKVQDWHFRLKQEEWILIAPPYPMHFLSPSMKQLCFLLVALFALTSMLTLATRAAYSDDASLEEQEVTAGEWIPDISLSVDPEEGDGEDGAYAEPPCVTLSSSLPEATIYYEFSDDGDPLVGGMEYTGTCVEIPASEDDRKTKFQAQAVHKANHNWKSPVIQDEFQVGEEEEIESLHLRRFVKEKKDDEDDDEKDNEDSITLPQALVEDALPPVPTEIENGAVLADSPTDLPIDPVEEETVTDPDALVKSGEEGGIVEDLEDLDKDPDTDKDAPVNVAAPEEGGGDAPASSESLNP